MNCAGRLRSGGDRLDICTDKNGEFHMRVVVQRVKRASVTIGGELHSSIGRGLLILLGVEESDELSELEWLVKKCANLRIFDDENGEMNR